MASTFKTSNLNLSQFVDNDTPSWLTDYNNDMLKIDQLTLSKSAYDANGDVATAGGIEAFAMPKAAYDENDEIKNAGGIAAYINLLLANKMDKQRPALLSLVTASGTAPVGWYFKTQENIVTIDAQINVTQAGMFFTEGMQVITLPAGYRPAVAFSRPAVVNYVGKRGAAVIQVNPDGRVLLALPSDVSNPSNLYINISFLAVQ